MKVLSNSINSISKYRRNVNTTLSRNYYKCSFKTFSEVPKEMLKLNTQTYIKNKKIVDDLLKVNDITNFTYFAALMQSDMYHEFLFQSLSKK
jgi:hypothetical protein